MHNKILSKGIFEIMSELFHLLQKSPACDAMLWRIAINHPAFDSFSTSPCSSSAPRTLHKEFKIFLPNKKTFMAIKICVSLCSAHMGFLCCCCQQQYNNVITVWNRQKTQKPNHWKGLCSYCSIAAAALPKLFYGSVKHSKVSPAFMLLGFKTSQKPELNGFFSCYFYTLHAGCSKMTDKFQINTF